MSKYEEALKAREERKKKEKEEKEETFQAKKDKIDAAYETYKQRQSQNAKGAVTDLAQRINAEINAVKKVSTPSWGKDSLRSTLDSTRENRVNVSKLIKEVESYKNYLDENTYNTFISSLSQVSDVYTSYLKSAEGRSQYESEEDYNKAQVGWLNPNVETNTETASKRKEYYQGNTNRIEEIEKELPWYAKTWLPNWAENIFLSKDKEALRDEAERLEAENNQYERLQKAMDDHYMPITDEVKQTASNRNYSNASAEELNVYDAGFRDVGKYLGDGIHYLDDDGNVINSYTGNIVRPADEYSRAVLNNDTEGFYNTVIQDKLGFFLSASEDDFVEAYNRLSAGSGNVNDTWANTLRDGDVDGWKQLTEDEITIYYYKLNTEGQASAYKFLKDMTTELTRRETEQRAKEIGEAGLLEQIALNIASIPMNVVGGFFAAGADAANLIRGEEINPYSRAHALQNDAGVIRAETAEDLDRITGNISIPWLDYSAGDVYQALMSGADSYLGGKFFGSTGYGMFMGMGAASSTAKDLYERGASSGQIIIGGLAAGIAEGIFEKYSIDKFVEMGDTKSKRDFIINILKQGGVEASEEAFTEIANTITDAIVMGSQTNVKDVGTFVKNVVNASLSGFISGGAMGGVASAINHAQYNNQAKQHGQDIIDEGGTDTLKQLALEMAGANQNKQGQKIADLAGKVANKASAKNVGILSDYMGDTITTQNRADIENALIKKGLSKKDAKRVAEYLGSTEALTDKQKAEIEGNENIKAVYNELLNNSKSTISERGRNLLAARLGVDTKNANIKASESGELSLRNDVDVEKRVSESGETTNASTGEKIVIDKKNPIAKVKYEDGERIVYFNTDHGIIEASNVKYANKEEGLLYEAFSDMNPAFANAVIKNYDGSVPLQTYINGMREGMILYGMHNFQAVGTDISKNSFLADLSEADQAFALKLGRAYAKADAKKASKDLRSAIKNAAERAEASKGASTSEATQNKAKKGNVYFEEGAKEQTHKQHKKIVSLAKHLAKAIGIDIVFYDSRITGKKAGQGANGYYDADTDTIYLDLQNAKDDAKTIAYTLSHELVHFIKKWSPQKFNTFAEFLMEQYASHGVSAANLLKQKMVELGTTDADLAYEEMIADACETMLLDSNAMVKLMELRKSDLELFEKIKLHIYKILNDIREAYKNLGYQPSSDEAKALLGMKDTLEKFYSMFEDAAVDATKNYQALGTEGYNEFIAKSTENVNETIFGEASVDIGKTESGVKHQLKAHKTVGEASIAYNERHKKVHKAILQVGVESMYEMAEAMLPYLEEEGILPPDIPGKTIFKNGSYGKTGENTTLCVRTLTYEDFKDRVAEKVGRPLTVSESLLVSQKIYDIATEPQCIYCYVAADRKAYDEYLGEYWKAMDKYIKAMRKGGDSKALYTEYLAGRKDTDAQKKRWSQWEAIAKSGKEYISASDLTTKRKRDGIIARKNAFSDQIKDAQRYAQSASWAKTVCDYRAYKGDILKMTSAFVDMLNSEYGLRMYSFSDYTPAFIVENMQMIIDASVKGLKSLAYTKDTDYVEIFASTGQAINVSCFARWDAEKGTFVEDNRQGANWEKTKNLRKQYRNVGAVMVATNDAMVEWALKQDWVDVVIPYHIVKTGTTIANEYQWNNYTSESADRVGNKTANIYPTEHNNDFATYSNLLNERGITPRFSRWYDMVAKGELTEDQYMKLVNEVRLPASELSPVVPSFNLDAAKKSFGIDNEGKVIEGGFVDKGGYMGGWYRQGVDVNQEVMAVSEDIKAGNSSLDVDYGMSKASKEKVEQRYKRQEKPRSAQAQRDEGYMLSESKFYQLYSAHKLTYGNRGGEINSVIEKIKKDGFISTTSNSNVLPTSTMRYFHYDRDGKVKFDNIVQARYAPKKGDYVLFVPNNYVTKDDIIKNGFKPFDYEIGVVEYDYQPYYELYEKTYKQHEELDSGSIKKQAKRGSGDYRDPITIDDVKALKAIAAERGKISVKDLSNGEIKALEKWAYKYWSNPQTKTKSPFFRAWFGDWRESTNFDVEVVDTKSDTRKDIVNNDTGWTVKASRQVHKETSNHKGSAEVNAVKYLPYIDDITKKAILFDSVLSDKDNENSLMFHTMYAYTEAMGYPALLKLKVEELFYFSNTESGVFQRDYILQNIEEESLSKRNRLSRPNHLKKDSSVISIAELYDFVKRYEKNFIPSEASKVVNPDGTPMVVYHGSSVRDIEVFQTTNANGTGGLYLSTNRKVAEGFAGEDGEVYETYVNLRSPLIVDANGAYYDSIAVPSEMRGSKYVFGSTVDTNAIAAYARENNYDGVIIKNVREATGFGDDIIAFNPTQVKSATDNIGTFDSNNPNIRYQKKKVSNRTLLANALETTAQNDIERNKLTQYKEKIALIESEQEKLTEIRAKIKELSFAKGQRDTEAIKKLQFEANQTANRINTYDRQLLNLESTTALKGVLEREKEMVRKRTEQKGQEKLDAYREKMTKTQRELLTRYNDQRKEQREKATERRDKTTLRRKIRKLVKELNSLFKNGNKKRNIKEEMKGAVASSLALADVLFNDDIKNEDIVRLGVASVTTKESEYLNKYRDLLDVRDSLHAEIESIYGNGMVRETVLVEVGKVEEKLKKVNGQIAYLNNKLSDLFERERARLNKSTVDAIIDELITEYSKLKDSENGYIKNAYSEAMEKRLSAFKEALQGTVAKDMDVYQLQEFYDTFKAIEHMIRHSNSLFREGRTEDLMTYVSNVQGEIYEASTEQRDRGLATEKIVGMLNEFSWNNLRPVDAVERLGSETFEKLFWDFVHAMGTAARDITEAGEVIASAREKFGYSKWNMELADTTFTTRDGLTFKPSLADKLSIYAYSQRDQAEDHMVDGGFTYDTGRTYKETKNGKTYVRRKLSNTYRLSKEDIKTVISSLTQEQRDYVDAILPYLTDMGKKGNEVSMTLYGIELFGEKVYFPLQSSRDYLSSTTQTLGATPTMASLANSGFTKQTKPHASNPIVLRGFDDVVLEHIEKMSNYHALVIPIENLRRVFDNVGREMEGMPISTKALIGSRFGVAAQKYFEQWLTDINGGITPSGAKSILGKLFSRAKGTSVAANLSVVAQQYFSIIRAMEVVNPKYFTPFLNGEAKKTDMKQYEELLKYAPIAIIKEMNGFDVGSGGRTKDYIGYEGARKDAKYYKKKADDLWMAGASAMDKLGWVTIWKAVKAEVSSEQKLTPGTEAFYEACRVRFTEVVTKTQVYDSVASRSGYMRSQHDSVKYATSFMGEPTAIVGRYFIAGLNLVRAIKTKDKAKIKSAALRLGRVATVIAVSNVLGKLAQSLVYGGRDDDEDEAYLERWMRNFAEALADDLKWYTPLNYLPFGRDIVSIMEGWDVERPDMTLIADMVSSFKKVTDGDLTLDDSLALIGSVGNFFGQPLKNIIREIKSAINVVGDIFDDIHPTDIGGAFAEGWTGDERSKTEMLYESIMSGDTERLEVIKATYKTETAYTSALRTALTENDSRIAEAVMAHYEGDVNKRASLSLEIEKEGNFTQNIVRGAINNEISRLDNKVKAALKAKETDTAEYKKIVKELREMYPKDFVEKMLKDTIVEDEEETASKDISLYKMDDYYDSIVGGNISTANAAKEDIIKTKVANGKDRDEAEESFESDFRSYIGKKYKSGEVSRSTASNLLTQYGGYDSDKTYWELKKWDFKMANGEDASYSKYTDFYDAVQTGSNLKAVIKEYTDHGDEKKTLASQITTYYKPLYKEMSNSERANIKGYLLNAYVLLGYDRSKKSKDIDKWLED